MTDWKQLLLDLFLGGFALLAIHYIDRWLHWTRENPALGKLIHVEKKENHEPADSSV